MSEPRAMAPASPLPWREGQIGNLRVYAADGQGERSGLVAETFARENTRYIVHACNLYPELVAALNAFLKKWPEVEKRINGAFALQQVRSGVAYDGPNLVAELD